MRAYGPLLLLANLPLCLPIGRLVFGSYGAFCSALRRGVGLGARIWTLDDAEAESGAILDDLKANLILLLIIPAALAEDCLLRHWGLR